VIRKTLEEEGVKVPKHKWFDRIGHVDQDDLVLSGALAGLATAVYQPHKYPTVVGWRRPIGLACVRGLAFWVLGQPLIWYLNRHTIADDWKKYSAAKQKAHLAEIELLRKTSMKKQSKGTVFQWPASGSSFPAQMTAPTNPLLSHDLPPDPAILDSIGPGKAPHELAYDTWEEKVVALPTTDYRWEPTSSADGERSLQGHIEKLLERRQKLVKQVEWLWHELAIRENNYHNLPPGEDKDITRKKLELLGSMHKNLWVEISELDWMIGDSRKQILQLQSRNKGITWLPPTTVANASFANDKTGTQPVDESIWNRLIRDLRNHQENLQAVMASMDEVLLTDEKDSEEKEEFDRTLKEVKQNEEATEGLIQEFEDRGKK